MLTRSLAQEIARDTSAVIGFNVLITDGDGMVIGSGDESRVGTFHEASVGVMRTQEPAAHSSSQAHELRGVRPGVTLPLVIDGQAVGTVGITGSPAQVRRFGLVVRRQTEILLQESAMLRTRLLRERALEDLLRDIAAYDPELVEPDLVLFRASELGYDLGLRRVVVVVDVTAPAPHATDRHRPPQDVAVLRPELLRTIREVFADAQDVVADTASGRFAVLHRVPAPADRTPDGRVDDAMRAGVQGACHRVADIIRVRHGWAARVAIGGLATSVAGLHDSYQDACDALRLGPRIAAEDAVHSIGDLRIHQVLAAVGHRPRAHLVGHVAGSLRGQPDWPVLRQTLVAWCENGFGLVRTAAALHIHRNTLLYRLDKAEQLSGRTLRDHRATLALYLACLADQLDEAAVRRGAGDREPNLGPATDRPSPGREVGGSGVPAP